jgi:hypothetical protein
MPIYSSVSQNIEISDSNYLLGIFYQDPDTTEYGGGTVDKGVSKGNKSFTSKVEGGTPWVFRFLFNPTNFRYDMSVNSQVDWSIPNDNGAILAYPGIGGQISLTLLLDRVADMNAAKRWAKDKTKTPLGAGEYPYVLSEEQTMGILKRGTEYDIEYLFRVINGGPMPSTMLGSPDGALEMKTSNLGYIAGVPFIFKVHDHLKYRVMMSSISITHDIFTRDMVPIRSLLSITLERIPDFSTSNANQSAVDKVTTLALGVKATSTGSGSAGVRVAHGNGYTTAGI